MKKTLKNMLFGGLISSLMLTCLLLASCASTSSSSSFQNIRAVSWPIHQAQLTNLTTWQLKAAMGVHTPAKSGMVMLFWSQTPLSYKARVAGPLGVGGIRIYGQKGQVTLWRSATQKISAATPEALMRRELGWALPISGLYYWVRGIPMPGTRAKVQTNSQGLLTNLYQAGWSIQYKDYQAVNNIALPKQMLLSNQQLQIKIVITHWEI